jgi:hypothetical protein
MQRAIGESVSATNNPVRRREGLGAVWLKRQRRLQGSWTGMVTDAARGCNRRRGDGDGYGYAWICMLRSCAHMQEGESKVTRCRTRRDAGVDVRRRARARARVRMRACLRWTPLDWLDRPGHLRERRGEERRGEERRPRRRSTETGRTAYLAQAAQHNTTTTTTVTTQAPQQTAPHGPARTVWRTRFGAMAHRRGEFADPWTDQGSLFRTGGKGLDWTGC